MATPTADALVLLVTILVVVLAVSQAAPRRGQGCVYEGVVHAAGSRVFTEEPCLNCTCLRGALVCHLKVCPDLPNPPPRGCILLHRKDECCPKLVCQDDTKLLGGPFHHDQDTTEEFQLGSGCTVNGTIYAEGSAMDSSTLCEYCYCIRGQQHCVEPKCLLHLVGCQPAYTTNACCPTSYNCSSHMSATHDETTIATTTVTTKSDPRKTQGCMVGGVRHAEGTLVSSVASSECENCFCVKGRVQCTSLAFAPPLQGCSPIVKMGECWPTSYNCSGTTMDLQMTEHNFILKNVVGDRKLPNSVRSMPVLHHSLSTTSNYQQETVNEGRANNKLVNTMQKQNLEDQAVNKTMKKSQSTNKESGLQAEATNTEPVNSKNTTTTTTEQQHGLTTTSPVTTNSVNTGPNSNQTITHFNTSDTKSKVAITDNMVVMSSDKSNIEISTEPTTANHITISDITTTNTTPSSNNNTVVSRNTTISYANKTIPKTSTTPKSTTTPTNINTTISASRPSSTITTVNVNKTLSKKKTTLPNNSATKTTSNINTSSTPATTSSVIDTTLSNTNATPSTTDTTAVYDNTTSPTSTIYTTLPTTTTTHSNNDKINSKSTNTMANDTASSPVTISPTTERTTSITTTQEKTTTSNPLITTTPAEVQERTDMTEDGNEPLEEMEGQSTAASTDVDKTEETFAENKLITADGTTESLNDILTLLDTTTIIMPEELLVVNVTMHSNLSIRENNKTEAIVTASPPPSRSIPPEIEALLNITRKKDDDYEYDYNEPSLPPSLPNLRIIPFVAADAVVETMDKGSPTIYPVPDKLRPTESPVFFKASHPNLFSPPIETEGGFVPREPIMDGPFYESKYDLTYHTTNKNVPVDHLSLDITASTVTPQSITVPPKSKDGTDNCLSDGRDYHHGELLSKPDACIMCVCYFGEIHCQPPKCPTVKTGCRRVKEVEPSSCCGRIVCDEEESPTVVLDRIDVTLNPLQSPLLGGIVPPITVAEGVVTPDPFRDVIRTEAAPDLPSLIGNMNPYLIDRHTATHSTSTSPFPSLWSWTNLSSEEPSSSTPRTPTPTPAARDTTEPPHETLETRHNATDPPRQVLANQSHTPTATRTTAHIEFTTQVPREEKEDIEDFDKEDEDSFSLDNVFKLLFSGGDLTTSRPHSTTHSVPVSEGTQKTLQSIDRVDDFASSDNNQTDGDVTTSNVNRSETHLQGDPVAASGLLKLAGCNIYGRMYRVGRIISELSTPCRECMCTDIGVQCTKLSC